MATSVRGPGLGGAAGGGAGEDAPALPPSLTSTVGVPLVAAEGALAAAGSEANGVTGTVFSFGASAACASAEGAAAACSPRERSPSTSDGGTSPFPGVGGAVGAREGPAVGPPTPASETGAASMRDASPADGASSAPLGSSVPAAALRDDSAEASATGWGAGPSSMVRKKKEIHRGDKIEVYPPPPQSIWAGDG